MLSQKGFYRYLKLQKHTKIAKVMHIFSYSQNTIFHMHKIVLQGGITITD